MELTLIKYILHLGDLNASIKNNNNLKTLKKQNEDLNGCRDNDMEYEY